jgi:Flp pilus assembly protein TadD
MSRWSIVLMLAATAAAQQPDTKKPESKESKDAVQLPPEEDASAVPEQYSFNPVKSKRDVAVGEFYFKKGDYKGAALRFTSATRWNDANAEAWLKLGETREKQQDAKGAREAYERYLQLAPDAKNAPEVKRRLEKLK